MKQRTKNIVAAVAGTAVFAGLSYALYRVFAAPSTTPSTSLPVTTPSPTTSPAPMTASDACTKAAQLAAAAATSRDPNAERAPYEYWAKICSQQGGTPPPFPA